MIPYHVRYLRAETAEEAVQAFQAASEAGEQPCYFAGGTEIVTMARDRKLTAQTLIDIKRIPETRLVEDNDGELWFGAGLTLNELVEHDEPRLLGEAARAVADHTVRNSITLGGNIAGNLPYREAVLPFLVFDGTTELVGPKGSRTVALRDVFDKRLQLGPGELALRFALPTDARERATFYRRRTRDSRVDYPLVTVCMARFEGGLRFAVSGVFAYPIRSAAAEQALNAALAGGDAMRQGAASQGAASQGAAGLGSDAPAGSAGDYRTIEATAAEQAVAALPRTVVTDMRASAAYRRALLTQAIADGIQALHGGRQ